MIVVAAAVTGIGVAPVVPSGPVGPATVSAPPGGQYVPDPSPSGPSEASRARRCHIGGVVPNVLPDPVCTPGATNPDVTQDNITTTICHPGWSRKVRPSYSVTSRIKRTVIARYGAYAGTSMTGYELDHLIPISWGGALADVKNLWPETPSTPNPKDKVEAAGLRAICEGKITLADAQASIAADWTALAVRLHVKL